MQAATPPLFRRLSLLARLPSVHPFLPVPQLFRSNLLAGKKKRGQKVAELQFVRQRIVAEIKREEGEGRSDGPGGTTQLKNESAGDVDDCGLASTLLTRCSENTVHGTTTQTNTLNCNCPEMPTQQTLVCICPQAMTV